MEAKAAAQHDFYSCKRDLFFHFFFDILGCPSSGRAKPKSKEDSGHYTTPDFPRRTLAYTHLAPISMPFPFTWPAMRNVSGAPRRVLTTKEPGIGSDLVWVLVLVLDSWTAQKEILGWIFAMVLMLQQSTANKNVLIFDIHLKFNVIFGILPLYSLVFQLKIS